jgi:hypothetical protein
MMLEDRKPVVYTDPGSVSEQGERWCHPRNLKCRLGFTLAAFLVALVVFIVSMTSDSASMQGVRLPAASIAGFTLLSLVSTIYNIYCRPPAQPRNAFVPNAAVYHPNPNSAEPASRHSEPIPQINGYSYGAYEQSIAQPAPPPVYHAFPSHS